MVNGAVDWSTSVLTPKDHDHGPKPARAFAKPRRSATPSSHHLAVLNTLPGASERESDASSIIVALDPDHRVIDCKDSIQWILQRFRGGTWRGYSFHRNRDVLIQRSSAKGEALAILKALPEMHP